MASFVVQKRGQERYLAVLITVSGDVILRGPACVSLLACYLSLDVIRANANDFSKYELADSIDGKFFFELKGSDGIGIARSVIFETVADVYFGIEFVRRTIHSAIIEDYLH
jgi:uncharacterized protein YegP (UPF0339 family)